MADYVVTPASVLASNKANKSTGIAGVAITAGQVLAKDTDGTLKLHDANGTAPLNVVAGIALHGSLTGQPITYVKADAAFAPGFTIAVGQAVIASATPGGLCPDTDKASGWNLTEVGRGISGNKLKLAIDPLGETLP